MYNEYLEIRKDSISYRDNVFDGIADNDDELFNKKAYEFRHSTLINYDHLTKEQREEIAKRWENAANLPDDERFFVTAPTLQMAMKWLREKYNIHIEIHYLHKSKDYSYVINNVSNGGVMCVNGFDSYENAIEAAILECLTNLI